MQRVERMRVRTPDGPTWRQGCISLKVAGRKAGIYEVAKLAGALAQPSPYAGRLLPYFGSKAFRSSKTAVNRPLVASETWAESADRFS